MVDGLKKYYTDSAEKVSKEQYIELAEALGWTITEESLPVDINDFSLELQQYMEIMDMLPDRIDSFSGYILGKDMSNVSYLFDIYEVSDKVLGMQLLTIMINQYISSVNKRRKK